MVPLDTFMDAWEDGSFLMLPKYAIINNKKGVSDERYKYTVASRIRRGYKSGA